MPEESAQQALAHKIMKLIEMRYPEASTRPGFAKLAAQIRDATGAPMSSTYLWELATGRKHNLTQDSMATLSAFFGVPAGYFVDDELAARIDSQLELLTALRNEKVRSIALRADGLSDETLSAILTIVNNAKRIEDT